MESNYIQFIGDLKRSIVQSRYAAARLANREQLILYFKIGRMLSEKIEAEKWGAKVIQRIADDLQKQMPGLRGFSYKNLKNMRQFAEAYSSYFIDLQPSIFGQLSSAQFKSLPFPSEIPEPIKVIFKVGFSHHIVILNKCKGIDERLFYISHSSQNHWSVSLLEHHISADLFHNQGKLPNNFQNTMPEDQKASALKVFQDEYLMDFMAPGELEDERLFEQKVVAGIKKFILQLGQGFCFIANQYRLELAGEEFFIDLLFYSRPLQRLVAFELKRGKFKPEYAGQLNFYLNLLDEKIKLPHEHPAIGIILCKEKNNTVVEFAVRSIDKAMGVATYRHSYELPNEIRKVLPEAAELAKLME